MIFCYITVPSLCYWIHILIGLLSECKAAAENLPWFLRLHFIFHIEEFMLLFKINAFLYLYIYILALMQFHSSQTTSFPLLPFSNLFVIVAEVVFVILPWYHSHFMWGRLSSLLKWRAQKAGCREGESTAEADYSLCWGLEFTLIAGIPPDVLY